MAWQDGTPFPFSISSPGAAYAQREEVECGTIPYIWIASWAELAHDGIRFLLFYDALSSPK